MQSHLHLAVLTSLVTFAFAEVKVKFNDVGVRDASLDGIVSDEHLLFLVTVPSRLACASACLKYNCCAAFSTSPTDSQSDTLTCRGHDTKVISKTSTVNITGSKTYFVEEKPIGCNADCGTDSAWLRRPCTTVNDCPADLANIVCFQHMNQCLCEPGYYFSHCRDGCVPDCASRDLQFQFTEYQRLNIDGYNIDTISDCSTFEQGRRHCLDNALCRTFEIKYKEKCRLQEVTLLHPGISISVGSNYEYFQRTCF